MGSEMCIRDSIERAEVISSRKDEWEDLKDISVNTIKRMLKAG